MEFRNERQIIGESPAIRRILQTVAMAAPTRATVLLQGESGTGKELFARAIHDQSERRDRPVHQAQLRRAARGLVESALFGHEKGAFTGAIKRVEGAFERAHRGTLLLDEISEMRLDLQAKLLRVLQEQEFERVGGTSPSAWTCGSSPPPTATWPRRRPPAPSGRTSTTGSAPSPSRSRRCGDRPEDIPLLAYRFALRTGAGDGQADQGICARRRSSCCSATPGRATCGSCSTPSSAR
jgi:hypothetical protein